MIPLAASPLPIGTTASVVLVVSILIALLWIQSLFA